MLQRLVLPAALLVAALAGSTSGCGSTSSASCTDGSTLTYASFGQGFMSKYCASCHGSGKAEAGVVLTSASSVRSRSSQIDAVAGSGQSMPPSGSSGPSATERANLSEWIACGAP